MENVVRNNGWRRSCVRESSSQAHTPKGTATLLSCPEPSRPTRGARTAFQGACTSPSRYGNAACALQLPSSRPRGDRPGGRPGSRPGAKRTPVGAPGSDRNVPLLVPTGPVTVAGSPDRARTNGRRHRPPRRPPFRPPQPGPLPGPLPGSPPGSLPRAGAGARPEAPTGAAGGYFGERDRGPGGRRRPVGGLLLRARPGRPRRLRHLAGRGRRNGPRARRRDGGLPGAAAPRGTRSAGRVRGTPGTSLARRPKPPSGLTRPSRS